MPPSACTSDMALPGMQDFCIGPKSSSRDDVNSCNFAEKHHRLAGEHELPKIHAS